MTKIQKIILAISIITYLLGTQFRIMHWSYGQLIQVTGYFIFLLGFIPILLKSKFSLKPSGKQFYYYVSGFAALIFLTIAGILENLFESSTYVLILSGLAHLILFFFYFPITIKLYRASAMQNDRKKYRNRIIIVLVYFSLLLIFIGMSFFFHNRRKKMMMQKFEQKQQIESLEHARDSI